MLNRWRGLKYGWSCPSCACGNGRGVAPAYCPYCKHVVEFREYKKTFVWQTEDWEAPVDNPWFFFKIICGILSMVVLFCSGLLLLKICAPVGMVLLFVFCMIMATILAKGMAENMCR